MKVRAVLLLLVVALTRPAQADSDDAFASALDSKGFVRVKEGFFSPNKAPALSGGGSRVVARIGNGCTGAYISPDGYVLTAAHCVKMPLARKTRIGPLQTIEHQEDVTFYEATSGGLVDGLPSVLVAAGKGWSSPETNEVDLTNLVVVPGIVEKLRKFVSGDWAILRVARPGAIPCATSTARLPKNEEPVWAFGYPARTRRSSGESTNGISLKATTGVVSSDIEQSQWLATLNAPTQALYIQIYRPSMRDGHILLSDADGIGGMSGGPIFAISGELLGITKAGGSEQTLFRAHSTFGITVKKIFEDLSGSGRNPRDFFSCPAVPVKSI